MAQAGLIGKATLTAGTPAPLGAAVAAGEVAAVNINVVNPGSNTATVKVYVTSASTPTDDDLIDMDTLSTSKRTLLRTKEIVSEGERVFVSSDVAGVVARVSGFQDDKTGA